MKLTCKIQKAFCYKQVEPQSSYYTEERPKDFLWAILSLKGINLKNNNNNKEMKKKCDLLNLFVMLHSVWGRIDSYCAPKTSRHKPHNNPLNIV